jgi:hypothetical protein
MSEPVPNAEGTQLPVSLRGGSLPSTRALGERRNRHLFELGPATCAACAAAASSGLDPGTMSATWFPLSRMLSCVAVARVPSARVVISVTSSSTWTRTRGERRGNGAGVSATAPNTNPRGCATHHVDVVVKAAQHAHKLLLVLHYDPDLAANAAVDELEREEHGRSRRATCRRLRLRGGRGCRHGERRRHEKL